MRPLVFVLSVLAGLSPCTSSAQSAAEHMLLGDEAAKAFRAEDALKHYEAIVREDSSNFEALWKASMNASDLGEFLKDQKEREQLFDRATVLARRAVAVRPGDADAHFHLARALGMAALSVGVKERIRFAKEVRDVAQASLKIAPGHGGSLHVMGVWNAEVMRLSGLERLLAKTFLGGGFFSQASWDDAQAYMEKAVAAESARLTHHLDLARVYRDRKMTDKARESYRKVIDGQILYTNDQHYQREAAAELARLK